MEPHEDDMGADEAKKGTGLKPNNAFLARMLKGVTRGNQRVIDTNSSRAARKAVGAAGAASLRPVLLHAAKHGPTAVRKTALNAAQQAKLTLCTSLLAEVAQSFGFRLHVLGPDGATVPVSHWDKLQQEQAGSKGAAATTDGQLAAQQGGQDEEDPQQHDGEQIEGGDEDDVEEEPEEEQEEEEGEEGVVLRSLPLEHLHVALELGDTCLADARDKSKRNTKPPTPGSVPRGSAVLSSAANTSLPSQPTVRPRLALGTLQGLTSTLRRAASGSASAGTSPTSVAETLLLAAKRRVLIRQSSKTSQQEGDAEEEPADSTALGAGQPGSTTATPARPAAQGSTVKNKIVWAAGGADAAGEGGGATAGGGLPASAPSKRAPITLESSGNKTTTSAGGAAAAGAAAAGAGGGGGGNPPMGPPPALVKRAGVVVGRGSIDMQDATGGRVSRGGSSLQGGGSDAAEAGGCDGSPQRGPAASGTVSAPGSVSSGGKRPATALNQLFGAALRDIKKVKQVVVDEG